MRRDCSPEVLSLITKDCGGKWGQMEKVLYSEERSNITKDQNSMEKRCSHHFKNVYPRCNYLKKIWIFSLKLKMCKLCHVSLVIFK